MGFRVLLVAITGKDADTVHADYGVTPTGEYEEIPESPVTGATLPSGSYLLYINDEIDPDERTFARLSRDCSLLTCYANETVMNSLASSWRDAAEEWSVFHDAQQSIKHLKTSGNPPDELEPIQERLLAEQKDATDTDYVFDAPVELLAPLAASGTTRISMGRPPNRGRSWHGRLSVGRGRNDGGGRSADTRQNQRPAGNAGQ